MPPVAKFSRAQLDMMENTITHCYPSKSEHIFRNADLLFSRDQPYSRPEAISERSDQFRFSGLGKTGCDMTFDERHMSSPSFQTCDEIFVVGVAFDKFRKMLTVLDKIDSATFADHEEDVVGRLARRRANICDTIEGNLSDHGVVETISVDKL
jgi:hypothetical protein